MKIITFILLMELGIIPNGYLKMYESDREIYPAMSFYGDFKLESQLIDNHIFIGTGAKIYIWKNVDGYTFSPDYISFMFTAGFRFDPNNDNENEIEIGFRHYCEHPVIAWIGAYSNDMTWERWYSEAYMSVKLKLDITRR